MGVWFSLLALTAQGSVLRGPKRLMDVCAPLRDNDANLIRNEPLVHSLQVVAQPHTAHAGGGDREPALPELVGNADLTEGRLLDRQRYDGILDLLRHAVLQHRLLAADFLQ